VTIPAALTVDAIDEGVHHHVAAGKAKLLEEALNPVASSAHQRPAGDDLVLGRVLAYDEESGGAI